MGRILAIIGGGGKTTSMCAIAQSLKESAVLMTTTTHIFPVAPPVSRELLLDPDESQLQKALSRPGVVCAGVPEDKNGVQRLCPLSAVLLHHAAAQADWVVCETDGANCRPLKLHRATEPVMPDNTDLCLVVIGLSALGKPVSETIHRYDRNPHWAANPEQKTTWEEIRYCIRENITAAGLPKERIYVLLNQTDTLASQAQAEAWQQEVNQMGVSCMAGSMQQNPLPILQWLMHSGACPFAR